MSDSTIISGLGGRHHPFAHVALVATSVSEAIDAVKARGAAFSALVQASRTPICARGEDPHFSSADMRLLAVHGLTRKVGARVDGANLYRTSPKGAEVLEIVYQEVGIA